MGLLFWIIIGITVGGLGKLAARWPSWPFASPSMFAAIGGAVLGGFLVDLAIRGDSVIDFRGPSSIGALVGTLLILAVAQLMSQRTATSARP